MITIKRVEKASASENHYNYMYLSSSGQLLYIKGFYTPPYFVSAVSN